MTVALGLCGKHVAGFPLNRPQGNIQGEDMTPRQTAARFAAYVWYTSNRVAPRRVIEREAKRFSRRHWKAFLPAANEGLGRLLLDVSRVPLATRHSGRVRKQKEDRKRESAFAAA
jgi:hypothetical protein